MGRLAAYLLLVGVGVGAVLAEEQSPPDWRPVASGGNVHGGTEPGSMGETHEVAILNESVKPKLFGPVGDLINIGLRQSPRDYDLIGLPRANGNSEIDPFDSGLGIIGLRRKFAGGDENGTLALDNGGGSAVVRELEVDYFSPQSKPKIVIDDRQADAIHNKYRERNIYGGVGGFLGGVGGVTRDFDLLLSNSADFAGSLPQAEREPSYEGSGRRSNRSTIRVKEGESFDEAITRHTVGGAIFWIGILLLAYLAIFGVKGGKSTNKEGNQPDQK